MIRKIFILCIVLVFSGTLGVFLAQGQVQAPSILIVPKENVLPDNFEKKIIESINKKRADEKLTELKLNENLNKATKSRMGVIVAYDDYQGTTSALTREKALEIVDYNSTIIGDAFIIINSAEDDFMSMLLSDKIEKETILHPKFSEVGIAHYQSKGKNYYYLIFSNEQVKVSAVAVPSIKPVKITTWGGPELWDVVNNKRVEFGVGKLNKKDELCTIASIRLNQLLELNKLDGHAGFQPVLDRSDLKWISEKYNISEYLASGFATPSETVKGWESTLGHKSLLSGGEYVWGCVYAQNNFAVAIAAY
jgi:uncharacterized protein YkwD